MVTWIPLESNPEVMSKFLSDMGVPKSVVVSDVYGLDEGLLAMVPTPVYALMLLYPITEKQEEHKSGEEERIDAAGQEVSSDLYYMKQIVSNACGTVALIHAVANLQHKVPLTGGALKEFLDSTKDMTPEERGEALCNAESVSSAHESCAAEGQTEAPDREKKLDTHFIAFVNIGGSIYELDGRKKYPINHGSTTDETFLQDGAKVVQAFMDRDTAESRFAVLALTGPQ